MEKNVTVDCFDCLHLKPPVMEDEDNLLSKILKPPYCELGKRIRIRKPKSMFDYFSYPRKCNDIKNKLNICL